jgi:hypothetical protein
MTGEPGQPGSVETGSPLAADSPLRTPGAAAVAGIVFAVLLSVAVVLLKISIPADSASPGAWLTQPGRRSTVSAALQLVPFAGIAFIWFVGVVRDRIGAREDRFFATVFLGSGLVFVATVFAAAAVAGGLLATASGKAANGGAELALGRGAASALLNVYAMRMAAVFTLSAVAIARGTGFIPRWLQLAGVASAAALLIGNGISGWAILLFPAWVLAVSIAILAAGPAGRSPSPRR